jgi:guanylate kinase
MKRHKRIILVGPSAAGKNYIRETFAKKGYRSDISYTSRSPRDNEINGLDYHFITAEEFQERIFSGLFYEWVKYDNNYYGTGRYEWENADIFIMETNGVKAIYPADRDDCLIIYVNTSFDTRLKRMRERGWSDEKISERVRADQAKFRYFNDYDIQISSEIQD